MNIVNEANEIIRNCNEFLKAKNKYKESIKKISNYVQETSKKYFKIQCEIKRNYNIYNPIYEDKIPYGEIDTFTIENEFGDYYLVNCKYRDRDDENFYWDIKLPKDTSKLEDFLEDFKNELIKEYEEKKIEKEKNKKEKEYQLYLSLKSKFD